mgnify:CR=1 FL=1
MPLSGAGVEIVQSLNETRTSEFVFQGQKKDRPISGMAMEMLLRRMKVEVTTHGFRSSFRDWVGDATYLRFDDAHHRIALFPAERHGVQHINHQVESVDDVMRAYYFLRDRGVNIRFGPGRHATSGAVFLYFEGPDGMTFEYSTGVRMIENEETYRPRQLPFTAESFCMWGARPQIPEFQS